MAIDRWAVSCPFLKQNEWSCSFNHMTCFIHDNALRHEANWLEFSTKRAAMSTNL